MANIGGVFGLMAFERFQSCEDREPNVGIRRGEGKALELFVGVVLFVATIEDINVTGEDLDLIRGALDGFLCAFDRFLFISELEI